MTECQHCGSAAALYLCPSCITELRQQLLWLPTLAGYLLDAAHGQTRLDENVRHTEHYHHVKMNARASDLHAKIRSTIGQWSTDLAINRGYVISPPVTWHRPIAQYRYTINDYAVFLAAHTADLANDQDIGELVSDLRRYTKQAHAIINRHVPPQFCGPCPTLVTDHQRCAECGMRDHLCATRLMARRGAIEVCCPACGVTHRVEELVNRLLADADNFRCTIPDLHRVLRMLGTNIEIRTLYYWATPKVGRLKPAGYLRPDNRRIGAHRQSDDDKPVYRIGDARKQWAVSAVSGRRGRPLKAEGKQGK